MRRGVVVACGGAALVAAIVLGWNDVRNERNYRRLLADGDTALASQQTSLAVEAFSGAIALRPSAMLPYLKRGDTYLHRQEWAAAERDLRTASTLNPTAPQPWERLGDAALAAGRFGDATGSYRESLALEDRDARVLYKLALALYRDGSASAALAAADASLQLDAASAAAHYLKGLALVSEGELERAQNSLERAVKLDPAGIAPRMALASVQAARGQVGEELATREAVAALDLATPTALVSAAQAYAARGRPDQALAALTRAADQHPDAEAVVLARARLWVELANHSGDGDGLSRAIEVLSPLVSRPDASSEILTLYGRALLLDGSLAAAEPALRRATAQFPIAPDAFALLAEAAARRGHRAEAMTARAKHAALTGQRSGVTTVR